MAVIDRSVGMQGTTCRWPKPLTGQDIEVPVDVVIHERQQVIHVGMIWFDCYGEPSGYDMGGVDQAMAAGLLPFDKRLAAYLKGFPELIITLDHAATSAMYPLQSPWEFSGFRGLSIQTRV